MTRPELLSLISILDRQFVVRDMHGHAKLARAFHRQVATGRDQGINWTETFVLDWLGYLRVTPYEKRFEVLPVGAPCPTCGTTGSGANGILSGVTFPGGCSWRCAKCKATWISLDAEPGGRTLPWESPP